MSTLFTVLIVIASIALILVVLVQKSKGGGLSAGFSSSNAIMGVRKTTDFVEKATWGLVIAIMAMSIAVVIITPKEKGRESELIIPSERAVPNADMSTEGDIPTLPMPATSSLPTPSEEPAE